MSKTELDVSGDPSLALPAANGPISWRDFDPDRLEGEAVALRQELTTYRDRLDEILTHPHQYVVIKGDRIVGYYPTRTDALRAVLAQFGRSPALIKLVAESDLPLHLGNAR